MIFEALEQIKDSLASECVIVTDTVSSLQAGTSHGWEVIQKCVFFNFANKEIIFVGH